MQQLLSTGEEEAIVDWCRRMSDFFSLVTMLMLVSMAVAILQARSPQVIPGIHWGHRFLSRHPSIKLKYTISTTASDLPDTHAPWRILIVDGHSSHVAWPVVAYVLNHRIVPYCLPPHSTHLMQLLDIACFRPLERAYRAALQDFIYEHPEQSLGKQEFWDCLCIAHDQALTMTNILSGFEVSGIWPYCSEKVVDRYQNITEEAQSRPSTPFQMDHL